MRRDGSGIPNSDDDRSIRVCIAVHAPISASETFIRAHVAWLPFDITLVEGTGAEAKSDGSTLRAQTTRSRRNSAFAELLDRLNPGRRDDDDDAIVASFLQERKIDVVLAEYGTTAARFTSACRHARIPLIAHFHGFDASRREVIESYGNTYREMFNYAGRIIAVSRDMRTRLVQLGCPANKIIVSPYGPDPSFMEVEPSPESNQIITIGRFVEKKAPDLLIRAFGKALESQPDLELILVGDGPLRQLCEDLVVSLGIQGRVRFVGVATPGEVRAYLSESFLLAQHSVVATDGDSEGTPVAILEAAAAGLPVVATRHAGISDVVVDGETGFLVGERDIDGMAAGIVMLAKDRDRARTMGARGRERIALQFSLARHIAEIAGVVREMVAK